MSDIKKIYVHLPTVRSPGGRSSLLRNIYHLILSFLNLIRAALVGGPGVTFHAIMVMRSALLFGKGLSAAQIYSLMAAPMDTFRYFEFDFFWQTIDSRDSVGNYLDVSSPRLFNWRVLASSKTRRAVLLNPDGKDLAATAQLFEAAGVKKLCELRCVLVSELSEAPASFDVVTCISVLEHIPQDAAMAALQTMWGLLRSGGRLLLSVPCARKGFEEYTDFNEYELLTTGSDGFVFSQRFYDREMIEECIYSIVGKPVRSAYFGEKIAGTFASNRERQLSDAGYAFWRESWTMARQYGYFANTDSMPGLGVVAFEFVKP